MLHLLATTMANVHATGDSVVPGIFYDSVDVAEKIKYTSAPQIHPTALIADGAEIAPDVTIGPYTLIGENVRIGQGTRIGAHVVIEGWTDIGEYNEIFTGAIIGNIPQDMKFQNEKSYVLIGNNNVIREYVTINRGTNGGGGTTRISHHNLIMTAAHVAHDVQIGNHNVIANAVGIAGHVEIHDWVTVGFASGLHQFIKIGNMAMIGAGSMVSKDVTPYALITGNSPKLYGVNIERLRRNGYSSEAKKDINRAYKILFKMNLTLEVAIEKIKVEFPNNDDVNCIIQFILQSTRGIYR